MTKTFFLCALILSASAARENPFFEADISRSLPVTSNIPDTLPKLTSTSYTLPNQARILKEVSFTIQNVDGSIETQVVQVDRSIDWHSPLVISQSSRGISGGSSNDYSANSMADFGFLRIDTKGKRLAISSKYQMMRHFSLTDPNRIIIDYKHQEVFTPKEKILNAPPYASASVANHGKFVRLTLVLDGRYDYTLKNNAGMISINCR